MATITDSQNVVNSLETAPDRLRAEIGSYFSEIPTSIVDPLGNVTVTGASSYMFKNYAIGIKNHYITTIADNDQVLFPTKRATIYLSGVEERFRDHDQWQDYIRQTIATGTSF